MTWPTKKPPSGVVAELPATGDYVPLNGAALCELRALLHGDPSPELVEFASMMGVTRETSK